MMVGVCGCNEDYCRMVGGDGGREQRGTAIICLGFYFFFQAEDGIRDLIVTGVQTCALPISAFPILGRYRGSVGQGVGQRMGKAVGERGGLMNSSPSKTAEAIVAVFVPPACREEDRKSVV